MQITITMNDQSGQLTVEAEGKEPYTCESAEECLDYVEMLLEGPETDAQAMWNEEAAKRQPEPEMMA